MGNPYQRRSGFTKLAKHRYLVHSRSQLIWACRDHHQRNGAQPANVNKVHIHGAKDEYPCIIEVRHTFHGIANLMDVRCINLGVYMLGLHRDTVRISKTISHSASQRAVSLPSTAAGVPLNLIHLTPKEAGVR